MAKTVYMVADDGARKVFEDPERTWGQGDGGTVEVDSVLRDAKWIALGDGRTLYRCEPISADEEPAPALRTVKAYVAFDPGYVGVQNVYAASTPGSLRVSSACRGYIFEIEMREVAPPPAPKRETGWAVKNPSTGSLYGRDGYGLGTPFVFSSYGSAEEMAKTLVTGVAVEVYRDTLGPVDDE